MRKRLSILPIVLFLSGFLATGQTPWLEDFETYTTGDQLGDSDLNNPPAGDDWSVTEAGTPGNFAVNDPVFGDPVFEAQNTQGEGEWTSEAIDVSGLINVTIEFELSTNGLANGDDYMDGYYSLDGGGDVLIGGIDGNDGTTSFSVVVDVSAASTLELVVKGDADCDNPFFGVCDGMRLDDIAIFTVEDLYSITSADWDQPGTWSLTSGGASCVCRPYRSDNVFIEGNDVVDIDDDAFAAALDVESGSTLRWTAGADLTMSADATVTVDGPAGSISRNGQSADLIFDEDGTSTITANNPISLTRIVIGSDDIDLTLTGSSTITLAGDFSVTTSNGGSLTNNLTGTLGVDRLFFNDDNFAVTNNGTIDITTNLQVNNAGDNGNSLTNSSGSTVNILGALFLGNSPNFTLSNSGTIDQEGNCGFLVPGPVLENLNGATWEFAGANVDDDIDAIFNANNGTNSFVFDGTGQEVFNGSFSNVTFANSGTKTTNDPVIQIFGNLTIEAGVTLNPDTGNDDIELGGNWINNGGNFTEGTEMVTFNGGGAQSITSASGTETFYDLILDNSGQTVTANDNIVVTNQLDFPSAGYLDIRGQTLTINSWADGDIPTFGTNRGVLFDATGTFTINGVGAGETANFPVLLSLVATDYARVDILNQDGGNTSFSLNSVCNYVNTIATCSGGTQVTANGVDLTWDISSGSTNADVTLYWDSGTKELSGFDRAACQVNHYTGGNWTLLGTPGAATLFSGAVYYKTNTTTSFSGFGVSSNFAPLPVEFLDFSAQIVDGRVNLLWSTAWEQDNDFFTVERSADGSEFEGIIEIKGAGNSTEVIEYRTTDNLPLEGLSFYRIKQTDFDGQFDYSKVISVTIENLNNQAVQVFPNPIQQNGSFKVRIRNLKEEAPVTMQLFSAVGTMVEERTYGTLQNNRGITVIEPNVDLRPGLYVLRIIFEGQTFTDRIVVN